MKNLSLGWLSWLTIGLTLAKDSAFEKDKINIIKQLDVHNYDAELKNSKNLLVEFFAPWETCYILSQSESFTRAVSQSESRITII